MRISEMKVSGRQVMRFEFADKNELENRAANVLIDFIMQLCEDDRVFGFGHLDEKGANYVDIPTKAYKASIRKMKAQERAEMMREMGRKGGQKSRRTLTPEQARAMAEKRHAKG